MAEEQSREERLRELTDKLDRLKEEYTALMNHKNELYNKFERKFDEIKEQRIQSTKEWGEKETESAETLRVGQMYGIENDYNYQLELLEDRIMKLIQSKAKLIMDVFPEYYRILQESDCDIAKILPKMGAKRLVKVNGPIVPEQQRSEDMEEIKSYTSVTAKNGTLTCRTGSFKESGNVRLVFMDGEETFGEITKIGESNVEVSLENEKETVVIPFLALETEMIVMENR